MSVAIEMLRTTPSPTGYYAKALAGSIDTCFDCAQASGYAAELTRAALTACRDACRRCAEECEGHADMHEHCRICAEVCRRCEQACDHLDDLRVCELANQIIKAQRDEIAEMDWLVDDIAENGEATTRADAEARPVPEFSSENVRDDC